MPCSAGLSCAWSTLKLAMSDPKVDELRLPMAVLSRVMKSCLPDSAAISKDARTYMMRACIVFILYILSQAEDYASSKKRKTVTVEDVMMSLKTSGFDHLLDHLNDAFEFYNAARANRAIKPKPKPQKHVQSVATD
uniref:DNA polymerase epsilon subunit 3 n=1 Tax=Angiostrongylus cantonensis TaxID=6313 RepID=A0A0K0CV21_ANGCA